MKVRTWSRYCFSWSGSRQYAAKLYSQNIRKKLRTAKKFKMTRPDHIPSMQNHFIIENGTFASAFWKNFFNGSCLSDTIRGTEAKHQSLLSRIVSHVSFKPRDTAAIASKNIKNDEKVQRDTLFRVSLTTNYVMTIGPFIEFLCDQARIREARYS